MLIYKITYKRNNETNNKFYLFSNKFDLEFINYIQEDYIMAI